MRLRWFRSPDGETYIDADRRFIIEYIARSYGLYLAKIEGDTVVRSSTTIGKFRTCREARRAAENFEQVKRRP